MEFSPKQEMGSSLLSVESKLLISLTDVFTSGFAVSSNSEHFGAAPGVSPLPVFEPEIESKSLPVDPRLPVSLSTFQFVVSLMHREGIVRVSEDG